MSVIEIWKDGIFVAKYYVDSLEEGLIIFHKEYGDGYEFEFYDNSEE